MRRSTFALSASILAAVLLLALSSSARADDGVRFRGGAYLHGGGVIVGDHGGDGGPGIGGQIGVQIDDGWAVYAASEVDFLFRECCGVIGSSLMVEHTWSDAVSLGVGPGAHLAASFVPDAEPDEPGGGKIGWTQVGGDLRVAWHPVRELIHEGDANSIRRRAAFTIAFQGGVYVADGIGVVVMPRLALGYTAY